MTAALDSLSRVAGQTVHKLAIEEFHNPDCDRIRYFFWLGNKRDESATHTFTLSSNRSIQENLSELDEFVREQQLNPF